MLLLNDKHLIHHNPSEAVFTADDTKAVVAICVVLVPELAVGAIGVPVN